MDSPEKCIDLPLLPPIFTLTSSRSPVREARGKNSMAARSRIAALAPLRHEEPGVFPAQTQRAYCILRSANDINFFFCISFWIACHSWLTMTKRREQRASVRCQVPSIEEHRDTTLLTSQQDTSLYLVGSLPCRRGHASDVMFRA